MLPHPRRAVLAATAAAALAALPSASAHAVAAPGLAAPSHVTVTVAVGAVDVAWRSDAAPGTSYAVTSVPRGLSCTTTATSCAITVDEDAARRWRFAVTASTTLGPPATSPPSQLSDPVAVRTLLVVAGQSNATGAESFPRIATTGEDLLGPPAANGADHHDLISWTSWSPDGSRPWRIAGTPGPTPVPLDTPQQIIWSKHGVPIQFFGPEIGLARRIWTLDHLAVTIVKTTWPGSTLADDWAPGSPTGDLAHAIRRIRAVMAVDASHHQLDVVGGVLWYQGESDSLVPADAAAYAANLASLIADVRADVPTATSAPFCLVKMDLTSFYAYELATGALDEAAVASDVAGATLVRAADDQVADSVPGVSEVDTIGLHRTDGREHLDGRSELIVGRRVGNLLAPLLP